VIQNNFHMDLTPQTVNKCTNSILRKVNYKFSSVLFVNTASNATRKHLRFFQWMPAFWDPMLSLGNSSQCLHL